MKETGTSKIESNFRKLRRELSTMTFEDKIDHLWRYYKINIFLLILIPVVLVLILTSVFKKEPQIIMKGHFCNISLSEEGHSYLTGDYVSFCGLSAEEYTSSVEYYSTAGLNMSSAGGEGVDTGLKVVLAVASGTLDYIACDPVAVEYLTTQDCFLPLDKVLTSAQLEKYVEGLYFFADPETGERYAVAIDASKLPFFESNAQGDGPYYFGFAKKESPDVKRLQEFFSYISRWENLE